MNGAQIEHILNIIEDKSAFNRETVRREVALYLQNNLSTVADALALNGETVIPTSYGGIKLTKGDLSLTHA